MTRIPVNVHVCQCGECNPELLKAKHLMGPGHYVVGLVPRPLYVKLDGQDLTLHTYECYVAPNRGIGYVKIFSKSKHICQTCGRGACSAKLYGLVTVNNVRG